MTGFCLPYAGEVSVTVSGPTGPKLAIESTWPNPARSDISVSFTLPSSRPATLGLHDIAGREINRIEVGPLGAGTHVVNLTQGLTIKSGMYFVRLSQGDETMSKRVSIFP